MFASFQTGVFLLVAILLNMVHNIGTQGLSWKDVVIFDIGLANVNFAEFIGVSFPDISDIGVLIDFAVVFLLL